MMEERRKKEAAWELLTGDLFAPPFGASVPGGYSLSITDFTQSLGAELLTNGDFALWTGNNPNSWTVTGESGADPAVSETAPGGGVGNGAATFLSTATASQPGINQSVLSAAGWYEFAADMTARTSGGVRLVDSGLAGLNNSTISSVRTIKRTFQAASAPATIRAIGAAPHLFTIDNASVKQITPNAQVDAVADGTFDFTFTAGTTFAGSMIGVIYRGVDVSNYWIFYLSRKTDNSDWDAYVARVATNAPATNTLLAAGVGAVTGLRVITAGNTHRLFTVASGVATQRGADQTDANLNTAVKISTIYSPGTTPVILQAAA